MNNTKHLQEDKSGQAVVNSGAGIAKKISYNDKDLYFADEYGNKTLATRGKDKYQKVDKQNIGDTHAPTNVNHGDQINNTSEEVTTGNNTIDSMLGKKEEVPMTHSWNKEAKQYSDKIYQQGKAETESEYSVKASELKTEAQTSQENLEMQKYTNAQTADKLGWSGGYVLDQQRQMNVLKAGIQAQLYNTQELNRLGLESSLAAARLNADLENQKLAHQYYQDAITNAINISNQTGRYISPEASDYLTQQRAAEQILATADPNSAEYAKAQNIINYVDNYFYENGIDKQGIKTLNLIAAEQNALSLQYQKAQLDISFLEAAENSDEYKEGKAGIYVDDKGKTVYLGASEEDPFGNGIDIVSFSSITSDELKRICNLNSEGKNASFYEDCMEYKLEEISKYYQNFLDKQGVIASEKSWKEFSEGAGASLIENYKELLTLDITTFDIQKVLATTKIPGTNFDLHSDLTVTYTPEDKQNSGEELPKDIQTQISNIRKDTTLSETEKEQKIQEVMNKHTQTSIAKETSAEVNTKGDTFNNNDGDRKSGNNFSIKIGSTIYRVENGKKVIADSETWKQLNSISQQTGAVVTYKDAIYVRDTAAWYIVQARADGYEDNWKDLCKALNVKGSNRIEDLE